MGTRRRLLLTTAELARELGIKTDSVRRRASLEEWPFEWTSNTRGGKTKLFDITQLPLEVDLPALDPDEEFFVIQKADYPLTDEEILAEYRKKYEERSKRRRSGIVRVGFKAFLPIGVSFVGDQHVGAECDVDGMVRDAEIIAKTDGMFAVSGGDGIDNHIKHWSGIINSRSHPADELQAFRAYLKIFSHKILMLISGNHDAWTQDRTGMNVIRSMAKDLNILYSPNWKGVLEVYFQDNIDLDEDGEFANIEDTESRPYRILLQHKARWNSGLNPGHACQRTLERGDVDADIVAIGHHHVGVCLPFELHGRKRLGIRWSSYKVRDSWGTRHGFTSDQVATCPTVVLYPGTRKMLGFADVRDAATFLTAERARLREQRLT